jgi:ABC-type transport system involved in cytochrome c biogenesis permease subunit
MTWSLPSRGVLFGGLIIVGLFVLSQSQYGDAFESVLYVSYGSAIPVLFVVVIIPGVYFSIRHLMSA